MPFSLRFLNPALLDKFSPKGEGGDLCYAGVRCDELVCGRSNVAWWMLSPEQHAEEWVMLTFGALLGLAVLWSLRDRAYFDALSSSKGSGAPPVGGSASIPLRPFLLVCSLALNAAAWFYKGATGKGIYAYQVVPCHMMNLFQLVLLVIPDGLLFQCVGNLVLCWTINPASALAVPDTSGLHMPLETEHFYAMHYFICAVPFVLAGSGAVHVGPWSRCLWWVLVQICIFALIYYTTVTPLAIVTGLNLNYMMQPPPGFTSGVLAGEQYRLWSTAGLSAMFLASMIMMKLTSAIGSALGLKKNANSDAAVGAKKRE